MTKEIWILAKYFAINSEYQEFPLKTEILLSFFLNVGFSNNNNNNNNDVK